MRRYLWILLFAGLCSGSLLSMGAASGHEGSLPLGDGNVSAQPKAGHVFSCPVNFRRAGTVKPQPWIRGDRWYPSEKVTVDGQMLWPDSAIALSLDGDRRLVTANGLPNHATGRFPMDRSSLAYSYDRNPNGISSQRILLNLPAKPVTAQVPSCLPMGMIGFALSGVAIYNALDVAGLDAAAHEVQDKCSGHPQAKGEYHYHNLTPCMTDAAGAAGRHSDLLGYALDGFGIYGAVGDRARRLTNADLDACHGHVGTVNWDGRQQTMYHYHFTQEYPYSLGCFAGTPVRMQRRPPPR